VLKRLLSQEGHLGQSRACSQTVPGKSHG